MVLRPGFCFLPSTVDWQFEDPTENYVDRNFIPIDGNEKWLIDSFDQIENVFVLIISSRRNTVTFFELCINFTNFPAEASLSTTTIVWVYGSETDWQWLTVTDSDCIDWGVPYTSSKIASVL